MGRWWPTLVLLLLAAASGVVLRQLEQQPALPGTDSGHTPDFFMEGFRSTVMGLDGEPVRVLEARELLHFPDTQTKELEEPYLTLYQPDRPPWHVRSERGWVSASGDVLLLQGAVHVWRDTPGGERIVDIHTHDLRILPDTDYGETDKPVSITTQSQTSHGTGMRAYLGENRLELLARVKTEMTGHLQP